jgi:hypothetical protein
MGSGKLVKSLLVLAIGPTDRKLVFFFPFKVRSGNSRTYHLLLGMLVGGHVSTPPAAFTAVSMQRIGLAKQFL